MNVAQARAAPWLRGRTLAERVDDVAALPTSESERRLERWRGDFPDEAALTQRLRLAGLEPAQLPGVLAAASAPGTGPQPAWWRWAMDAYGPGARSPVGDQRLEVDAQIGTGCARLVAPLVRQARHELADHAARLVVANPEVALPFEAAMIAKRLVRPLGMELAGLCVPAVTLELTAARLGGKLPGSDARERAAGFLRDLGRAERARELFRENPALVRLLYDRVRLGTEAASELLSRLATDWPQLATDILGPDPGSISGLEWLGDPHEGGRRVTRLDFVGGARLVYKPRSLAVDAAYQDLLRWIDETGGEPPSRAAALLRPEEDDRYGWQEWVDAEGCDSPGQVDRYFRRLGGQMALLHALRATDLHHENIIAAGEHPVIVDLECLLHPRLGGPRSAAIDPLIAETGMDCVLRVGLLPRADASFGVDMSGLGGGPELDAPAMAAGVVNDGTDEARVGMLAVELGPGPNAARLGDRPVRPHDHVESLTAGFSTAYGLLRRHADELLAPGGALAAFATVPTRVVLRFSKAYADLLRAQICDPAALDDGLAREEAFNPLWRGVRRRPDLVQAAGAELYDLWCGDVPRFTGLPGGADLHHHAAGRLDAALVPHTFEGVDCVRRLDDRDLERQLAFVRASVIAAADRSQPHHEVPAPAPTSDPATLLEGAREAARRLGMLALHDGDLAGWLAPTGVGGQSGRVLRAVGPGLAAGQTGIALFLAVCAEVTGDAPARALARAAVAQLYEQIAADTDDDEIGLWSGAGGVIWGMARLADVLDEADLVERAVALALRKAHAARADRLGLGLGEGLAGWATGVAMLARRTDDHRLLAESRRCADILLDAPPPAGGGMLGTAGNGLVLVQLGDLLHESRMATEGAARVRAASQASQRDGSWAAGAAGATTALALLAGRRDAGQAAEAERDALRCSLIAVRRLGLGRDHSLATGDLGALCAIRLAARVLGDDALRDDAERRAAATLAATKRLGTLCSGPGGAEEPGLLTGVAGIGWGWLELAGARPLLLRPRGSAARGRRP